MKLNTNILAMNSVRNLMATGLKQKTALERLSSGKKINRAADNAAGYAIAKKMALQSSGLKMASKNSLDGISLIQTAEGALDEVHSMLQRMRELSVQASNGTNNIEDREAIQKEINQLTSEISRIGKTTEFNQMKMFSSKNEDGTYKPTMNIPVQAGANAKQMVDIEFQEMAAFTLKISGQVAGGQVEDLSNPSVPPAPPNHITDAKYTTVDNVVPRYDDTKPEYSLDVTSQKTANAAIAVYSNAISKISEIRSILGAAQNRFEHNIKSLNAAEENVTSSMSRIEDADMAEEMTEFTKYNILQQAGTSMLAQANQLPQTVLKLLES
ncbi:hypothetical protein HMPREF9629_00547 [Peptoanaerobacter stomatis]|jgi:flagellin protein|uniref:Flagellin n=1 Tax=Peptoanaerobacter stomatis TaxID=796937 RepID=G9X2E0_9FIRM|nr:flagellin [Peptoanaerobacter stomatis]EHL11010.1 hypothetical protein HMPREF9629_00547 [Peptoanaerobacter stomatis]